LNSSNANLSVVKPIDREALVLATGSATIELKVIAIDSRSMLSSESLVHIEIVDANDNTPCFASDLFRFHLNENQFYAENTTIGVVAAVDLDEADILQYSIHSDYDDKFSIDSQGRI